MVMKKNILHFRGRTLELSEVKCQVYNLFSKGLAKNKYVCRCLCHTEKTNQARYSGLLILGGIPVNSCVHVNIFIIKG